MMGSSGLSSKNRQQIQRLQRSVRQAENLGNFEYATRINLVLGYT